MVVEVLLTLLVAGVLMAGAIKLITYLFPRSPSRRPQSVHQSKRHKQTQFSRKRP